MARVTRDGQIYRGWVIWTLSHEFPRFHQVDSDSPTLLMK